MTVWARSEDSSKLDFIRFSRFSCDFYLNDGCLIKAKNYQNSEYVNVLNLGLSIKSPRSLIISPHSVSRKSRIWSCCKFYVQNFRLLPIRLQKLNFLSPFCRKSEIKHSLNSRDKSRDFTEMVTDGHQIFEKKIS